MMSWYRRLMIVNIAVLASARAAHAAPILLTAFHTSGSPGVAPQTEARVEFAIGLWTVDAPSDWHELRDGTFWDDGGQVVVEFQRDGSGAFEGFAALATDGVNGHCVLPIRWPDGTGGAPGGYESRLFDRSPSAGAPRI